MATIIRPTVSSYMDSDAFEEMQEFVDNFWGSEENEKIFPIAAWRMQQLFEGSQMSVALRVKNIDKVPFVDAQWVVFDESTADALAGDSSEPGIYYVISPAFFESMIETATNNVAFHRLIIVARIGENAETSTKHVFILAADWEEIEGGGGEGGGAGIKIPAS